MSNYTKPGYCPERTSMTPFEAACLIACVDDSRCPDLAKCCSHDCGITCMHPVGLDNRNGECNSAISALRQDILCQSDSFDRYKDAILLFFNFYFKWTPL